MLSAGGKAPFLQTEPCGCPACECDEGSLQEQVLPPPLSSTCRKPFSNHAPHLEMLTCLIGSCSEARACLAQLQPLGAPGWFLSQHPQHLLAFKKTQPTETTPKLLWSEPDHSVKLSFWILRWMWVSWNRKAVCICNFLMNFHGQIFKDMFYLHDIQTFSWTSKSLYVVKRQCIRGICELLIF